jgi:CDP-diacylglycerol--glycerol-3-phosphate 3-phosphatidyltransferase
MSTHAEQRRISRRAERARRMWAAAFNLPNQLTTLRLLLAVVMFGLIVWEHYLAALVLFVIAAGTDWLDGYFARKWNQVTTLGRILDPFADKVIVCGAFIFLVAPMAHAPWWGLRAWMVVVIVARELLVTALRSFVEDRGGDFSAKMSGKLKMVLQCVAAGVCLFFLTYPDAGHEAPPWVWGAMAVSLWSAVALTVFSGVAYVLIAARMIRGER